MRVCVICIKSNHSTDRRFNLIVILIEFKLVLTPRKPNLHQDKDVDPNHQETHQV